ncbi:hypothetical protein Tco_0611157 [Tanacetum coccineum]
MLGNSPVFIGQARGAGILLARTHIWRLRPAVMEQQKENHWLDDGAYLMNFRYLKGQPKLGLWYPRDSPFDLEAFSDSDYAGASLDRKSITGDETVYKEWEDRMERAATTASSLEAEQDSGNINRTQSMATLNESFPQGTDSGSGPRYALTESLPIYVSLIEQFWQTAFASTLENGDMEITATIDRKVKVVSEASIRRHLKLEDSDVESHHTPISDPSTSQPPTLPPFMQTTHVAEEATTMLHDSPLLRVHSLGSDEGSMTLNELTVLRTTLSKKVETLESDLKQTKQTYEDEDELEDPSKHGRKIAQIDEDGRITLVQMSAQTQGRHEHDFDESDFEFIAPEEDYTAEPDISTANLPVSTTEEDKVATRARKTWVGRSSEIARTTDEEERQRIARVHEEASTFNLINERKRKFAQQIAEQRKNKPMTQAQQRTYMYNYINNIGSHTLQQLKKCSFDEVKELFETTMKRVNTFTPMESDDTVPKVVAGSSKIDAKQELNQES